MSRIVTKTKIISMILLVTYFISACQLATKSSEDNTLLESNELALSVIATIETTIP